jgi:GNAT superfamily N-acetyltransferase
MKLRLVNYLLTQEQYFVDELYQLVFRPESVRFFQAEKDGDVLNGWLYLKGQENSADWHLARLIGQAETAFEITGRLPAHELQLLVSESDSERITGFEKIGRIFWYQSSIDNGAKFKDLQNAFFQENSFKNLKLVRKEAPVLNENWNCANISLYLLQNEMMIAYIKTIRETPNFVEVYIEVTPGRRERGIGTFLLSAFSCLVHEIGKKVSYAVDESNLASISIAEKAGLTRYFSLVRLG